MRFLHLLHLNKIFQNKLIRILDHPNPPIPSPLWPYVALAPGIGPTVILLALHPTQRPSLHPQTVFWRDGTTQH